MVINRALSVGNHGNCDVDGDGDVDAIDVQLAIKGALGIGNDGDLVANPNPNLGEQKTIVILLSFEDDGISDSDYVSNSNHIVFDYLDRYIKEISYNKAWISGNIVGPYKISNTGCWQSGPWQDNHGILLEKAIQAADNDVNFKNYNRIIIFNKDYDFCPASAQGSIGIIDESSSYYALMNSNEGKITASVLWFNPDLGINVDNNQVLIHEFGHNLGLSHVDGLKCYDNSNRITISDNCQTIPGLGSVFSDPMASAGRDAHFNAYNKKIIGWLTNQNIITTNNGDYLLEPLELSSNGIKLIQIPIPYLPYQYFLEFRIPTGFDEYDPLGYPLDGVFLYSNQPGSKNTFSLDLPPFPNPDNFDFGPLTVGTYVDSDIGLSVTINSISENGADISITTTSSITQCSDGINNDGYSDTYVDDADFSCLINGVYDSNQISEYEPMAECQDKLDNDFDGNIDLYDSDCDDTQDNTE
ncbi:hypothetical protein COU53_01005 [Candidatus Pacearchaeota archaeon CG10_big_fil_rev_8_21_14_0_10_30_48]|nr:MAG: hypothetical protein COU53_01005 [Candidatus Pacearchaeota archaeon CG10_big_fil_rev_8_21_14_0_10_30_48]